MRSWHFPAHASPQTTDGLSVAVWLMAKGQAALGHEVTLVLNGPPSTSALELAEQTGLHLIHTPAGAWRYDPMILKLKPALLSKPPHLDHLALRVHSYASCFGSIPG